MRFTTDKQRGAAGERHPATQTARSRRLRQAGRWAAAGVATAVLAGAAFVVGMQSAVACPFCDATAQTLSEEIANSDVVVLARLAKPAAQADGDAAPAPTGPASAGDGVNRATTFGPANPNTGIARFEIVEVLQGSPRLLGIRELSTVFFGTADDERIFFITGIDAAPIEWTTPLPLSAAAVEYIKKLSSLPPEGPDRLAYFQQYFEHEDNLLALDAYEEFARATYDQMIALGDRMQHGRLVELITDPAVSPNRRRLYLTMLGVCGSEADLPMLQAMILPDFRKVEPFVEGAASTALALGGPLGVALVPEILDTQQRRNKLGLDAAIGCYLTLGGPDRLDQIDDRFLRNPDAEITHVYSTIMALRVLGEETRTVPRERLLRSMRLLLDHPDFADQVIPDLARWEDWSVIDRLVEMYRASDARGFVRQPIVAYMTVAAEQQGEVGQQGAAALTELEKFDPESFDRARRMMAFGFLGRARPEGDNQNATRPASASDEAERLEGAAADTEEAANEAPASAPAIGPDTETEEPAPNVSEAESPQAALEDLPPDPADARFQQEAGLSPDRPAAPDSTQSLVEGTATPAAAAETENDSAADAGSASPAASTQNTTVAAAGVAQTSQPASSATPATSLLIGSAPLDPPHKFLIIVVPIASVGLLTGLFWLVLRSGSV